MDHPTRRRISSIVTIGACAALLAAPTPAPAKGPTCELDIHHAEWTRPVYQAGHWVSARLDVEAHDDGEGLLAPGSAGWHHCIASWVSYTRDSPLFADSVDTPQVVELWFVDDGDGVALAGWLDPLQAGGAYVDRASLVGESIRFEVEPNPDADIEPPEPVGLAVSYFDEASARARIELQVHDASDVLPDVERVGPHRDGWVEGHITLRSLTRDDVLESWMTCSVDGICATSTPRWKSGRYVIESLWLVDRLGNGADFAAHPLLDGVVLDLGPRGDPVDLARGALAPEQAPGVEPDEPLAPAAEPDEQLAAEPDEPSAPAGEPAPIAARRSPRACHAAPGDAPAGGALLALVALLGLRRRRAG